MIGIDANVLVRVFVVDDQNQRAAVRRVLASATPQKPVFINLMTLVESIWVLRSRFGFDKEQVIEAVKFLLSKPDIRLEHGEIVSVAVDTFVQSSADLPDILVALANRKAGCETTVTFDKRASRLDAMTLALG